MKTVASIVTDWPKALLKRTVPYPARLWLRDQQRQGFSIVNKILCKHQTFENREGFLNFNFILRETWRRDGISAILRIKNEEDKIYYCLKSIIRFFNEIILVDNNSEDRTLDIVRDFKSREDQDDKIKIYFYPFRVARCGPEHFRTPEDSVCNLAYYYNWALSKCSFKYVCKWDGDMVLRKEAQESFARFLQKLQTARKMCWSISGQAVYRDFAGNHFLATGEINSEIRIFPNGFNPRFYKVDLYEMLKSDPPLEEGEFDGVLFYELKFVDTDEFSHWSVTDIPTDRKKRELENFRLVKKNAISSATFEKLALTFLEDQVA